MTDDLHDLGTPNCPIHLVPMEPVGDDEWQARDAAWQCPEPGCAWGAPV